MERLVAIANAITVPEEGKPVKPGGLAVSLAKLDKALPGVRIAQMGFSGQYTDDPHYLKNIARHITYQTIGDKDFYTLDLPQNDYLGFYLGLSNSLLWPQLHNLSQYATYKPEDYKAWDRVNTYFAAAYSTIAKPNDRRRVDDYHFFALENKIKQLGHDRHPSGFQIHIGAPTRADIEAGPAGSREVMHTVANHMFAYDLVGVQTPRRLANWQDVFGEDGDYLPDFYGDPKLIVSDRGRPAYFGVYPASIDGESVEREARRMSGSPSVNKILRDYNRTRHADVDDQIEILMVGRLDYTKGYPEALTGIALAHTEYGIPLNELQSYNALPHSRAAIPAYARTIGGVEHLTTAFNSMFGSDFIQMHHDPNTDNGFTPEVTKGVMRRSKICLVTPLEDGINFVALEYIMSQLDEAPGVLIIGKNAGAAELLGDECAVIVDSSNPRDIARGIAAAKSISLEDRVAMNQAGKAKIKEYTNLRWAKTFDEHMLAAHKELSDNEVRDCAPILGVNA